MLEIDLGFPHLYDVEELGELPGTGKFADPVIFFPPPNHRPEHDGLWLKVTAASGRTWIGVFGLSAYSLSRVISSPDSRRLCVVAKGNAYIVKVDEPEIWEQIPVNPVMDVRLLQEERLLIFSDFVRLAAYGSNGLAWRSPQVCWDGLKIVSVTRETIEGTGFDPTNAITHESRFVVDLKTGRSLLPVPSSTAAKPVWLP